MKLKNNDEDWRQGREGDGDGMGTACGMRWDGDGDNEDNVGIETTSVNVGGIKTSSRGWNGDGVVILHPQFEKPLAYS